MAICSLPFQSQSCVTTAEEILFVVLPPCGVRCLTAFAIVPLRGSTFNSSRLLFRGGGERIRTADPLLAGQVLRPD